MREKEFIAVHRGGLLSLEDHRRLMIWAVVCIEHILPLIETGVQDQRLVHALKVAKEWKDGNSKTGPAMKAAYEAHAAAREISNPAAKALAKAIRQCLQRTWQTIVLARPCMLYKP